MGSPTQHIEKLGKAIWWESGMLVTRHLKFIVLSAMLLYYLVWLLKSMLKHDSVIYGLFHDVFFSLFQPIAEVVCAM